MQTQGMNENNAARQEEIKEDRKRLRMLWAGLTVYFLIMLNAFRYASQVPYQIFILGALINMTIIISIFVAMNKVRRRMQCRRREDLLTPTHGAQAATFFVLGKLE
jgi:hypothetical protein